MLAADGLACLLLQEFSRRLKQRGIDGFACHPGIARTDLYAKNDKSKPEGVAFDLFQKVCLQESTLELVVLLVLGGWIYQSTTF